MARHCDFCGRGRSRARPLHYSGPAYRFCRFCLIDVPRSQLVWGDVKQSIEIWQAELGMRMRRGNPMRSRSRRWPGFRQPKVDRKGK